VITKAGRMSDRIPRVTVVIPFLDPPESFLTEAVESVRSQTFRDWELLLVNDGSGPESTRAAEAFVHREPDRIRLIAHEDGRNHGIAAARSLGLGAARGEYVACLDADDLWFPNKLQDQLDILDAASHVDLIFGRSEYWRSWDSAATNSDGDIVPALRVADRTELGGKDYVLRLIRQQVMIPCPSSIVVRTDAARAVGGFGEGVTNLYEDQAFYAKLGLSGVILACDEVWDRYRIHRASVLGKASADRAVAARKQFLEWLEDYLSGQGVCSGDVRRALRVERWAADHPRGARLLRILRRLRG
jgi:glycosyltransferase involved in cell wall biosynthesis